MNASMDCSKGEKFVFALDDGSIEKRADPFSFFSAHPEGGTLVIETGVFTSNVKGNRDEKNGRFAQAARNAGWEIRSIGSRLTAKARNGAPKSDTNDAKAVLTLYQSGKHPTSPWPTVTKLDPDSFRSEPRVAVIRADRALMRRIYATIAPFLTTDDERTVFRTKTGWREARCVVTYLAARDTDTRDDFTTFLGVYGKGKNCYARSRFYYTQTRGSQKGIRYVPHAVRTIRRVRLALKSLAADIADSADNADISHSAA